jgi:hypothetical protein
VRAHAVAADEIVFDDIVPRDVGPVRALAQVNAGAQNIRLIGA